MTFDTAGGLSVAEQLARYFRRNGYVRRCSPELRTQMKTKYKKGDEVRLIASSETELVDIQRLLRSAGFKPTRPFKKARQLCQPIYGRSDVARFLELVGEATV